MIGKLFTKRFLSLFALLLLVGSSLRAQTVLTTPNPTSGAYFISTGGVPWDCMIFEVENTNICPIALTNLSTFHWGKGVPANGIPSANDSSYNLWYSLTSLSGAPNVTTGGGWTFVGNSGAINIDTFNQVTQIFAGMNVVIPPSSKARFAIQYKSTMSVMTNTTPPSVTQNGITLTSGGASNIYAGIFPTPSVTAANAIWGTPPNPPIVSFHWVGSATFIQLPPAAPVADVSLKPKYACIGDDVTLKASHPAPNAAGVYTWRNAGGTIISSNSTGTFVIDSITEAQGGRYYVTYSLCGAESASDSVTVIVSVPPAPTVDGKFDYCLNEQFEAVTVNGTNPKWYYIPSGGSPLPVVPTINTSSPNALIYYVSQTDIHGCESQERTEVRFRAAKKPFPPIVNTPVYYCEEAVPDQLYAFGDTLRWYYFEQGGVPTQIAPTPNTSVKDSFQYYVTQTIDGCESDRNRIDVVVTFKPNGIVLLDKKEICAKESIIIGYYGSAFPSSQYNWILPPKGATILNGGFDQGPIEIQLDSPGKFQVKLRVGNTGCISDEYTGEVKVKPLPYGVISVKQDVCLGQPELIEALKYTPGLDTFIWDFANAQTTHFTTDQGPYGIFWAQPGDKVVKVKFIHDGCEETVMDTVTVHAKPSAKIMATYQSYNDQSHLFGTVPYNPGDELCASDSLKVTVEKVEPGATYKWTPTRFFDTYSDEPVTYARVDFKSKIYVEVEDIYGCQNKDSLDVTTKSCCAMTFPNAFTPNNDGKNDLFRPITIGRREIKTFRIVNRYGQAVYESKTGGGIGWGWDGNTNGKPADVGTYFYLMSFVCDGETVDQAGEVILMR
ncbi:MAG: gliding motility-associated C-terminal domain-containing protein [Chitinophagaceae bacterium]|nr:gliding motility-associated C-terminal domain-containing protein [Chitinophagaceae bacterium]